MSNFTEFLGRLGNAILDVVNRKNKRNAVNDPANTIANGGRVQFSDKTIGDVSDQPKRNSNER